MCHLLFTYVDVVFKKLLENALRFETYVVLNIFCHHDAGRPTRISFQYRLNGFRINSFRNDFKVHYFVFVYP